MPTFEWQLKQSIECIPERINKSKQYIMMTVIKPKYNKNQIKRKHCYELNGEKKKK